MKRERRDDAGHSEPHPSSIPTGATLVSLRVMDETAVSDLVARVRHSAESKVSPPPGVEAELGELERRAVELGATEEELALAVLALLASARTDQGTP